MYDFETTNLSHKTCEVIQIAASTVDEEHKFSCYILPESNIHEEASNVTGLRITTAEGRRELTKNEFVLRTLQSYLAFKEFTQLFYALDSYTIAAALFLLLTMAKHMTC